MWSGLGVSFAYQQKMWQIKNRTQIELRDVVPNMKSKKDLMKLFS